MCTVFLRSGWKLTIFNFDTCKLVKTLKGNICLITELKPLYGCQVGKLKPKCRNTENKCQKTMFEELIFQLSLAKNRTILLFLTTCNCCSFSELFPLFFSQNQYNLARAQQSYKSLVQIHEKNGKFTCMRASEARQCGGSLDQSLLAPSLSLSLPVSPLRLVHTTQGGRIRSRHHYALWTHQWVKVSCFPTDYFLSSPTKVEMRHF